MNGVELTEIYKSLNPDCKAKVLKCSKTKAIEMIEALQAKVKISKTEKFIIVEGSNQAKELVNKQIDPKRRFFIVDEPKPKIDKHRLSKINQFIQAKSELENHQFGDLKQFVSWCKFLNIEPTTRQAAKFRNNRGSLYNKMVDPNINIYI